MFGFGFGKFKVLKSVSLVPNKLINVGYCVVGCVESRSVAWTRFVKG